MADAKPTPEEWAHGRNVAAVHNSRFGIQPEELDVLASSVAHTLAAHRQAVEARAGRGDAVSRSAVLEHIHSLVGWKHADRAVALSHLAVLVGELPGAADGTRTRGRGSDGD